MHRGYVAIWRKIRENPLWTEERAFSKLEAWLDILLEVRHSEEPTEVIIGNKVLLCGYAQSLRSLDTWAGRWGWSKARVRRFFALLSRLHMLETQNETVTTRITVVNYRKHDAKFQKRGAGETRERHGHAPHPAANKNETNDKNENTTPAPGEWATEELKTKWEEWLEYRRELGRKLPRRTVERQLDRLRAWGPEKAIAAIDQAIENGWLKLVDPDEREANRNGRNMRRPKKRRGCNDADDYKVSNLRG